MRHGHIQETTTSDPRPGPPRARIASGPDDWTVLQRGPDGRASCALAGEVTGAAPEDLVEVRLVREADGLPPAPGLDWRPAAREGATWFRALEEIPAGGLYRIETRVLPRSPGAWSAPRRGDTRHFLGVGDLWLVAGQSHAGGGGAGPAEDPPTPGVHLFGHDDRWRLAAHPFEDAGANRRLAATTHGVCALHSPWLAFGRRLQAALGHPIGILMTAVGGSAIDEWDPEHGPLFANALEAVRLAGGRVKGLVWCQGEADANRHQVLPYAERFLRLVAAFRKQLREPALPVLMSQLATHAPENPAPEDETSWTRMRELQRALAAATPRTTLVPTLDLPRGDPIHISAAGNLVFARRFADTALRVVYGHPEPPVALMPASLRWTDAERRSIALAFEPADCAWLARQPITDFTVEHVDGRVELPSVEPGPPGRLTLRLAAPAASGPVRVHAHAGLNPRCTLSDSRLRPVVAFSLGVEDAL